MCKDIGKFSKKIHQYQCHAIDLIIRKNEYLNQINIRSINQSAKISISIPVSTSYLF